MPGFDRTGPMGAGPMTGWARGRCDTAAPSDDYPPYGSGYAYGRGYGGGRGRRGGYGGGRRIRRGYGMDFGWYPPVAGQPVAAGKRDEAEALRDQAEYLSRSIAAINARIAELEKEPTE